MLTPFGVEMRKLRLDRHLRLMDMAGKIGVSTAFLSAIETGRKPVPPQLVTNVALEFGLSPKEVETLKRAEDKTKKEIKLVDISDPNRELVAAFARKVDGLPEEVLAALKKQVFESRDDEVPFKRTRRGLHVPPRGAVELWDIADQVRSTFVADSEIEFPIMDVLEFRLEKFIPNFEFQVGDKEEMGGDEGRVIAGSNVLMLREDVYEGAWNRRGRDRFTACHELAHLLMHRHVTLSRAMTESDKVFFDSEWQADTFAGALLMSRKHVASFESIEVASARCGMTEQAATVVKSKYAAKGYCQ